MARPNDPQGRMDRIVIGSQVADGIDNPHIFTRSHWSEIADSENLEYWIAQLKQGETATRKLRLRLQALHDGNERKCGYCGQRFYARAGAKYCSPSHRVMGNR